MGVCVRVRVRASMCVTFARIVLTHVNIKIHSVVRYRPLVVNIAWHVLHFNIISSHSYFEILKLIYRSCPRVTEARSQGDGVMVHPLLV